MLGVSSRGTTLRDLVELGHRLGLQSRAIRMDLPGLLEIALPAILHWDGDHFVVLISRRRNRLTIHDPALGERIVELGEMNSHFTGIALEVSPSPEFAIRTQAPKIEWNRLLGRIVGLKRSLAQLLILAVALQFIVLLMPLFTQWIIDNAIVSADLDLLWTLVIGWLIFLFLRTTLEFARGWLSIVASAQLTSQWSMRVNDHLLRLPSQWFEVRHIGDVVSKFQSMQSIQQALTGRLVEIFLDGVFGFLILLVLFIYSWKLAGIVLLAIGVYAAIRVLPHGKFHRTNDEALTKDALAQSHFIENLRAIQVIKLGNLEALRAAQWSNMATETINRKTVSQRMTLGFGTGYSIVFGVQSVLVLGLGASMAIEGVLSVGMLMAFVAYKDEFFGRAQRLIDNAMSIRMLRMHAERLGDIMLSIPEADDNTEHFASELKSAPSIEVRDLSFRYADNLQWVFRGISFQIHPGEHIALIGPTGCGKSTLAKVLLGLLKPGEGQVSMNGQISLQVGNREWRRRIGTVMQDDQLFSGSIFNNIASFDEKVQQDDVEQAARMAAIHDEIMKMPMAYHTHIGDMGSSLSGGQKQRILLARAFCRKPYVLLLDEATSHLDVATEVLVSASIKSLALTRITIAHRPETIATADRVIDLRQFIGDSRSTVFVDKRAPLDAN